MICRQIEITKFRDLGFSGETAISGVEGSGGFGGPKRGRGLQATWVKISRAMCLLWFQSATNVPKFRKSIFLHNFGKNVCLANFTFPKFS